MDVSDALKAISNPIRFSIVQWLKDPHEHFSLDGHLEDAVKVGVCVSVIQEKSGLSQSTISLYLSTLQRAGLVSSRRIGSWTYYKRDDRNIKYFLAELKNNL